MEIKLFSKWNWELFSFLLLFGGFTIHSLCWKYEELPQAWGTHQPVAIILLGPTGLLHLASSRLLSLLGMSGDRFTGTIKVKEKPHPLRHSRPGWMGSWAAWSGRWQPCPQQGVGTRWASRSSPTLAILWFYDYMIIWSSWCTSPGDHMQIINCRLISICPVWIYKISTAFQVRPAETSMSG